MGKVKKIGKMRTALIENQKRCLVIFITKLESRNLFLNRITIYDEK